MITALTVGIDALSITLVLALAAFGLAIIFGLIGVINLGHGAMLTLGAYFTWATTSAGVPFLLAVALAALGVGLIGLALEHFVIRFFYDRPFETLLLTWGFFPIATEVIKIAFGTDFRNVTNPLPLAFQLGPVDVPAYRTAVAGFSLALIGATAFVLYRTALGIKIRALLQNKEMASLLGLDIARTYKLVFTSGALIAGLGGADQPDAERRSVHRQHLPRALFFVVTVGGLGELLGGTLVGAFFIGGAETIIALASTQAFAQTIVFALAILVLRFRPQGVLGER